MTAVAKKPTIKGTTAPKKPRQTSTVDRRDRSIKHHYVNDQLADIRERYYGEKQKKSTSPTQSKKSKRDEKLAVTGVEETKKRRMTTSGLNANEARKALANELKNQIDR